MQRRAKIARRVVGREEGRWCRTRATRQGRHARAYSVGQHRCEDHVRKPGETPEQLAARILPTGADTLTKPLEFELGPLGKVVLVLYQVDSDDPVFTKDPSVYRGLVLVPHGKPDNYRIEPLPSQSAGAGTLMYEVKSVFAADADGDGAPELCVLSEAREAGARDTGNSHTDTDIFKWSGSRFVLMDQDDSRPLSDLRTAKAVRAKLKKMRP